MLGHTCCGTLEKVLQINYSFFNGKKGSLVWFNELLDYNEQKNETIPDLFTHLPHFIGPTYNNTQLLKSEKNLLNNKQKIKRLLLYYAY